MKPTIIETPMTLDDLRPVDVYADMDGTESFCFYDGVEHWCVAVGTQSAWTISPPRMSHVTLVRPWTKWKPVGQVPVGSLLHGDVFELGGHTGRIVSKSDVILVEWAGGEFPWPRDVLVNGATWDDPEDIPLGQHFMLSNDPDTLHIKARKEAGCPIPDAPEYRAVILSEIVALNPVERR